MKSNKAVIHTGAYYLRFAGVIDGKAKIIFRSDGHPDAEITVTDEGRLTMRRACVETAETATVVALED